jgi:hypothetical protein
MGVDRNDARGIAQMMRAGVGLIDGFRESAQSAALCLTCQLAKSSWGFRSLCLASNVACWRPRQSGWHQPQSPRRRH